LSAHAIVLGCGTSTGVPLIGCRCPVCTSNDPDNQRLRASLWLDLDGTRVLVDTSPDLRQQALLNQLPGVDLVVFTHAHADHVHGIDDLRMFNFLQWASIPCHAAPDVAAVLRARFRYIFNADHNMPTSLPRLELHEIDSEIPLGAGGKIVPVPIMHGHEPIYGYRFGNLAYLTDISAIPASSWPLLEGIDTVILGALRHEPHPTHLHIDAAVELVEQLGVRFAVLTHMSHDLDVQYLRRALPAHIRPAYDGMVISLQWP